MVQNLNPARGGKWIVGLTGGFGTGKSTVAHMWEALGACVIPADELAHEALMKGGPGYDQTRALFKGDAVETDQGLDRRKLAEIIFHDPKRRQQLEALVHPYVRQRLWDEIAEAEEGVVVLEIPLLFETGFDRFCDQTVVVNAPDSVADKRLLAKGFSMRDIENRRRAQMPLDQKLKRAHWVIENSGTLESTRREAEKVWKNLRPVLKGDK